MRNLFQVGDRIQLSHGSWDMYDTSDVYIVKTAFYLAEILAQAEQEINSTPEYIRLRKPYVTIPMMTEWLMTNLDLDRIKITEIYLGGNEFKKPDIK